MPENVVMIIIGVIFILIGISNYRGNIKSIHWYHRKRITEENIKPYGKNVGIGMIIIGLGLIIPGILMTFMDNKNFEYISIGCLIVGLLLIFYGQIKYNKGLF